MSLAVKPIQAKLSRLRAANNTHLSDALLMFGPLTVSGKKSPHLLVDS